MKIPIKGIIVANDEKWIYELFGYEVTTPRDVDQLLNEVENEEVPIDKLTDLVDESMQLLKNCKSMLKGAENKVESAFNEMED